jgi:hypothetical protein
MLAALTQRMSLMQGQMPRRLATDDRIAWPSMPADSHRAPAALSIVPMTCLPISQAASSWKDSPGGEADVDGKPSTRGRP